MGQMVREMHLIMAVFPYAFQIFLIFSISFLLCGMVLQSSFPFLLMLLLILNNRFHRFNGKYVLNKSVYLSFLLLFEFSKFSQFVAQVSFQFLSRSAPISPIRTQSLSVVLSRLIILYLKINRNQHKNNVLPMLELVLECSKRSVTFSATIDPL